MPSLRTFALAALCCFLIALSYLVVLRGAFAIWHNPINPYYRPNMGLDRNSALFLALPLVTIPYLLGGWFLKRVRLAPYALPIGLITTLGERILIFTAAYFVRERFRQVTESGEVYYVEGSADLVGSIQAEALPYFGWDYILLGVLISILILSLAARGMGWIQERRIIVTD